MTITNGKYKGGIQKRVDYMKKIEKYYKKETKEGK